MSLEQVGLYDSIEFSYNFDSKGTNPFDIPIHASFFDMIGKRKYVEGFYDGGNNYKIRFMPDKTGIWSYTVFINDSLLEKGRFECIPSRIKGPLIPDQNDPYHLNFLNGDPYYLLGNTAYCSISAYRSSRENYCRLLDYYTERNFNWTRFFLEETSFPMEGGFIWPWGGTPGEPDYNTFDQAHFRIAEEIIKEMAERNMIASIILIHAQDEVHKKTGNRKLHIFRKYIHYAIARLGSYWNVVWDMANEWELGGNFNYAEMDELGYFLHSSDPYQRLTSCHHRGRFEFFDKEWTDISSLQHRGSPIQINQVALQNRTFKKPVINEEYGYELDCHCPPNDPDNVRHDHWALALAGAYGSYGDKTKGDKKGVYWSAMIGDAIDPQAPDMLKHLYSFITKTGYKDMVPSNSFVNESAAGVFCLVNPGSEYIIYMITGLGVTVNLTHVFGTVSVCWYNPRTGEYIPHKDMDVQMNQLEPHEVTHDFSFLPPDYENDWILYIKKK